jgi:hypothetical protein
MLYALCAWPVNIALLCHDVKSYFSKHFNISSKTCNTILYSETILDIFEHTLKYSNQTKQIYSTYSWFRLIKQHIYFAILWYIKITVSQWVKYHLTACTPTLTSPRLNPQSVVVHNILHPFSFHPIITLIFTLNCSMTILPINCLNSYLTIFLGL